MTDEREDFDYFELQKNGTGSQDKIPESKIIVYSFDKYQIKVRLTLNNEFIGIEEIKVNKEFLTHKQKITPKGYHDVDKLYEE